MAAAPSLDVDAILDSALADEGEQIAERHHLHEAKQARAESQVLEPYRYDPVGWVEAFAPRIELDGYHREILQALIEVGRVAMRGPRGCGKTALLVLAQLWLTTTRSGLGIEFSSVVAAPKWDQLSDFYWVELARQVRWLDWDAMGLTRWRTDQELLKTAIHLEHGNVLSASPRSPETTEGAHVPPGGSLMLQVDEAKGVAPKVWESLEGSLSNIEDIDAYVLAGSTPGYPIGEFYLIHAGRRRGWFARHVTKDEALAAGRISQSWVDKMADDHGVESIVYQQHVAAEFVGSDEGSIVSVRAALAAFDRWEERLASGWAPPPISGFGVDIAAQGADRTVIAPLHGTDFVGELQTLPYTDTVDTQNHVAHLLRTNPGSQAMVDADGMGHHVAQNLQTGLHLPAHKFLGNEGVPEWKDRTETFGAVNRRSAAIWHLRDLLEDPDATLCLPRSDELLAELTAPKWTIDSMSRIKIEPKEQTKKVLGRSPDFLDACVYVMSLGIQFTAPPPVEWTPDKDWVAQRSNTDWSRRPDTVTVGRGGGQVGVGRSGY